ncbi:hypothetical protein WR52_11115 [Bacillus cereus]|uniref:hypothetical protein n=1 Tax=Bacillus cereus TaxID=1396 RepID=UPI0007B6F16C|nr:hypothetical protein [Bacillus cereus]ANC19295.1 hypothetical protein WR52_11115 [Bacillus cereus]
MEKKSKLNNSGKSNQNTNVKKRIMFNRDEDYYFITYNILIILKAYGCKNSKSKWIDYRKLSYLLPLVSNSSLLDLYIRYIDDNRIPPKEDIELLRDTYFKSKLRLKLITSILFTLEANQLVSLMKNDRRHTIDIWINQENISKTFFKSELFEAEVQNINKLKNTIPRLKSLSTKTLLERLYTNNGVSVWEA